MAKKFSAKYLGGHPANGNTCNVRLSATKKGIYIKADKKPHFTIEWANIKSIDERTEHYVKNSGLMTGLGWMTGNPLMMMAGNNPTSGKDTFLVVEFEDHTGFNSSIVFQSYEAAQAKAFFIQSRSKFIKAAEKTKAMPVASKAPTTTQTPGSTPAPKKDNKMAMLVLGWIFLPYAMVPIYIFQNKKEIFTDKDPQKIGIAAAGAVWVVVSICIGAFSK